MMTAAIIWPTSIKNSSVEFVIAAYQVSHKMVESEIGVVVVGVVHRRFRIFLPELR